MTVSEVLQAMPNLTQGPPTGIQMLEDTQTAPSAQASVEDAEAEPDEAVSEQNVDAPGVTAVEAPQESPLVDTEVISATVTVRNRSVNVRSGPGLNFSVVFGANQGQVFQALGLSDDEAWWQICCVPGPNDDRENPTQKAWISNRVVDVSEGAAALGVLRPLFPDDLSAVWDVNYQCGSDRCVVTECSAQISAAVRSASDPRWLEIDRNVTWEPGCGEDSTWLHQIDKSDGVERYPNSTGLFFFNYWVGAKPGTMNSQYTLGDGAVHSWCSDEQSAEVEEEGGWVSAYNGVACYDVRTGMLVAMKYTKRWLFTGEFDGEEYEKAYFGDFEVYEVALKETNAALGVVGD